MKLHHLSPILWTKNLEETISFYENILGFQGKSNFPNFVSLTRDEAEIMFIVPEPESEHIKNGQAFFPKAFLTGSIFIFMDEVDKLWETVKDKPIVKTPIADRPYLMRDFSIFDNNGYELVFGENISHR
jgi:catechol 2,3-dioxygenase-like lactoylglutathione lyase family enzyme